MFEVADLRITRDEQEASITLKQGSQKITLSIEEFTSIAARIGITGRRRQLNRNSQKRNKPKKKNNNRFKD